MQSIVTRARTYVSEYPRSAAFGTLLLVGLLLLVLLGKSSTQTEEERLSEIMRITKTDWVRGNPDTAKAILVEYSDFQCPACAAHHDIITQLMTDEGSVALVYRHFPLTAIHPAAALAAAAAEAAGRQNKFFEMHDLLFTHQREWSRTTDPEPLFVEYARDLEIDIDIFLQDLHNPEIKARITTAEHGARALGLKGTPSFFINGRELPPVRTYAEFKNILLSHIYPAS